jgi:hypothetical protein
LTGRDAQEGHRAGMAAFSLLAPRLLAAGRRRAAAYGREDALGRLLVYGGMNMGCGGVSAVSGRLPEQIDGLLKAASDPSYVPIANSAFKAVTDVPTSHAGDASPSFDKNHSSWNFERTSSMHPNSASARIRQ